LNQPKLQLNWLNLATLALPLIVILGLFAPTEKAPPKFQRQVLPFQSDW
jgi:hypothetical protein